MDRIMMGKERIKVDMALKKKGREQSVVKDIYFDRNQRAYHRRNHAGTGGKRGLYGYDPRYL